jgi:hypothetical protein
VLHCSRRVRLSFCCSKPSHAPLHRRTLTSSAKQPSRRDNCRAQSAVSPFELTGSASSNLAFSTS